MVIVSKRSAPELVVISLEGLCLIGLFLVYIRQNSLIRHNGSVNTPSMLQQEFEDGQEFYIRRRPKDTPIDRGTFI